MSFGLQSANMDIADSNSHPFSVLTPDFVLDALESLGYICDGRLLALNSYENRVYQVGIEDSDPLIAKFYRPARWSDEQILEEHEFSFELAEQELPIVAPLVQDGISLFRCGEGDTEFRFALFPRKGGHAPELDNEDNLLILGRLLGRMHRVGSAQQFQHRPKISVDKFGQDSVGFITNHFIPADLKASYNAIAQDVLSRVNELYSANELTFIRVHGDCHVGNILWRDDNPHFVDLDDARMAPAIQDIWMLLSGDRSQQITQLSVVMEGYKDFNEFDARELCIAESLRALRILHYSAWLAKRWDDPAFPHSFPWFNTQRYWEEQILILREQRAALDEPPLPIY